MKARILLLILATVAACTPKNSPRYTHEAEKTWQPAETPNDDSVEVQSLNTFEMKAVYTAIKNPQADMKASVLSKLAPFVLNAKFIETPANRTTKLGEMISAFNQAFVRQLDAKVQDTSPEFAQLKQDYINMAMSGCSRDLRRDCKNLEWMSLFPNHARIFTLLAKDFDAPIDAALKKAGSPQACMAIGGACRSLVEDRYKLLSISAWNKRSHYDETEFKIAYLKHARLFSMFVQADLTCGADEKEEACRARQLSAERRNPDTNTMSYSYLAQMHSQIFQTIIGKYQPKSYSDPEFKSFVEAFNPWTYSIRAGDIFQGSASRMFEFGTQCCLYVDKSRNQLSDAVLNAIQESQFAKDHFIATAGISFRNLIPAIKKEHLIGKGNPNHRYDTHEYDLFRNLGILDVAKRIERDPSFFNEYFFVVDRLFRGHLSSAEVEKLLRATNPDRSRTQLPRMISEYVKIHLAYMVVETNRFMAEIYKENLASDRVFQEAISRSRALTGRWHEIQQQTNLLRQIMVSYVNSLNLPDNKLAEFQQTDATLKSVTRNIHYLTVFPNMLVMTYHLTKANASVAFTTWWGADFKKEGSQILKQLLNGEEKQTWFPYGTNAEMTDRLTLLYSLEYLLSTEALNSFVAQETGGAGKDRSSFFDLIFGKYLDDGVFELRTALTAFERNTIANPRLTWVNEICTYETGKGGIPPKVSVNFMDLAKFTYSGVGNANGVNAQISQYLTSSATSLQLLRKSIESRRTYVEAMVHVIASELLRSGKIKTLNDEHADLKKARSILAELNELRSRLGEVFLTTHKRYYDCYTKLQEVERRRMNRLYDEERTYLSQVFDLMKPLFTMTDGAAMEAKAEEINKALPTLLARRGADASRPYFSRVVGRNFLFGQYDMLMRMKTRIEADIFRVPSQKEAALIGPSSYDRARSVEVIYAVTGIEDSSMFTNAVVYPISMRGTTEADRAEFIRAGMSLLGGKEAILEWQKGRAEERTLEWNSDKGADKGSSYLLSLMEFYLMGPMTSKDGKVLQVTKEELTNAYIDALASQSLDPIDLANARDFSQNGRRPKEDFLDSVFQKDGQTPEALFYSLMRETNKMAAMDMTVTGPLKDSLDLAKTAISLQAFQDPNNSVRAFVFQPSNAVKEAVLNIYGDSVNTRLQRVADLFTYLHQIDRDLEPLELDPRLAQPFYYENGVEYRWYDKTRRNLIDRTKANDLKYLIDIFAQKTGNIYGTRTKVKY